MSGGRRSKATDPRIAAILNALRAGNTRTAAAAYAEIGRMTFYRWLEDGTFRDAVEKAEADAEIRFAAQVAKAATDGTWQAAAWWLERRRSEDYARRERVDYTFDIRKEAERLGLDPDAAIAEAEQIIAGHP